MARKIIYSLLFLFALFSAYVFVGYTAPNEYKGQVTEFFHDRRAVIWKNLTSVDAVMLRKRDVESVKLISDDIHGITWRENLRNGGFRIMSITERDIPSRFVVERLKSSNGVVGKWTFELHEIEDKTEITILEESQNTNIWLRAYYTLMGRDILLKREVKSLRVSLFQRLLTTE